MRPRKQVLALTSLLCVLIGSAGCRDMPQAESEAISTTVSPQGAQTSHPDPLAIPADPAAINESYLLRVLNSLFAAETDRIRHEMTVRQRDREWHSWLAALYSPEEHDFQIRIFDKIEPSLDGYRPVEEVEDISVAEITSVITAGPDCVFVKAPYRRAAILPGEPEWQDVYVGLVPHHGLADPSRNNTPWWFVSWLEYANGVEPENPCL